MKNNNHSSLRALIFCAVLMTITAASDSLRGVFLPQFKSSFSLSETSASHIIMISYIGNLLFLSVGGFLSDRMPRKRFIGGVICLWSAALLMYVLTENYYILLVCMIFSMGGSTMLSTSVNVITPLMFASPAALVSIFNFVQGVGITATQNVGGRFADSLRSWHIANLIILALAAICLALLFTLKLPDPEPTKSERISPLSIIKRPQSIFLILICGCYFVAEHGLMNWLTSYGSEHLGFTVSKSAFYLSLFFGGITVGRLVFAPVIDKVGIFKCLLIYSAVGALLYTVGIALGRGGMLILGISGLAFSIIYPLLVMLIGKFFDPSCAGSATGLILSIATLFDIGFNAFFGPLIEKVGYGKAMAVMPAAMILVAVLLFSLKFTVKQSKEIR
ncbi:MAG: MFS transporter [Ruminococcus sp.]|nr:MFS transporter [Ruminococcus sp.]